MSPEPADWLARAEQALSSARLLLATDPDGSASRSYYAAFYPISAVFAAAGKSFRKHSALEAAVHRDLVRSGGWPPEFGKAYSRLAARRLTGDYGAELHVSSEEAAEAVDLAQRVVAEVNKRLQGS
ncbi:MAG TPA: HEPN domain-containing protein [Thermoanaerobaculia bacterium]|nr:HEPN domain-containing protein [Thermoanaerobaculia bacterium]